MHHVEEHIVELYYLGGLEDESLRKGIEKHLTECYSCNELYLKIREFYQEVDNINSLNPKESKLLGSSSISTRPNIGSNFSYLPKGFHNIFNNSILYFVTHPVRTGLTAFTAFAFFLIGLNFNTLFKSNDPVVYKLNSKESIVNFYNNSSEKIFSLRYDLREGLDAHSLENTFNTKYSELVDLDDDGYKEFVTILHNISGGISGIDALNVFDEDGKLKFSKKIGSSFTFRNVFFDSQFENKALIVYDFDNDGLKEIYVLSTHYNSPVLVTKFDSNGNWLGEYWHYGWFWGFNYLKIGEKEGILLCGLNDSDPNNRRPVVSFIDPNKIKGKIQSSQAIGFDGTSILYENNYKFFPIIKPDVEHTSKPRITNMLSTDNKEFVKVNYYLNNEDALGSLFLDKDFSVFEIKVVDPYLAKFGQLSKADHELLMKK